MADHVVDGYRQVLVRRRAVGVEAEHRDGAGIDDAPDPGIQRRFHDVARAFDVVGIHSIRVGHPQAVVGGDMVKRIATLKRARQRSAVAEFAFERFHPKTVDIAPVAVGADEDAHRLTGADELAGDRRSDEAGGAGDQRRHPGARRRTSAA